MLPVQPRCLYSYLNKFPFAKDYYEIQWYLSDTLFKSGRLQEAGEAVQLLKGKDHAIGMGPCGTSCWSDDRSWWMHTGR